MPVGGEEANIFMSPDDDVGSGGDGDGEGVCC